MSEPCADCASIWYALQINISLSVFSHAILPVVFVSVAILIALNSNRKLFPTAAGQIAYTAKTLAKVRFVVIRVIWVFVLKM